MDLSNLAIKHVAITIPKTISESDYQKELDAAERGEILNYKLRYIPKGIVPGKSRCYVVHNGKVIGYHIIKGVFKGKFTCSTTGKKWEGLFLQRTGKFIRVKSKVHMSGFRGFRYIETVE